MLLINGRIIIYLKTKANSNVKPAIYEANIYYYWTIITLVVICILSKLNTSET